MTDKYVACRICGFLTHKRNAYDIGEGSICPLCFMSLGVVEAFDEEGFPTQELKDAIAREIAEPEVF